jgi:DNA-binding response OmpR family regulator
VLKRIRNTQADDNVKVLLLTASSELKHVEEGLALGADDYLAKPFSHVALVHRVRKLLFSVSKVLPAEARS